jgi:hypothetical protein
VARELDAFGRRLLAERTARGWAVFEPGADGKRRPALDLPVPAFVETEAELLRYVADVCHERASPRHPDVRWVR